MTHEFRGASLHDAVQQAVGRNAPIFEQKKLNNVTQKFDFAARARLGSALIVGEGDISFALALARLKGVTPSCLLATAYENEVDLGNTAYDNAAKLLKLGAQVKTGVDATCLSKPIGQRRFRTIIFQFPNVTSREALYGQNPNHVLVTRFLKSSRAHLKSGGLVVISTVDNPFCEGAFKMDDAAKKAGFEAPDIYTFNPKDYPAYSHQNTADEESAINEHTAFATIGFST
ncbi:DUF2431 domain-containing protein [Roseobacter sp. YSTF-M11]|uniref:DUF2431 domain-containing protein n=1 Tax=Roseobacter insulae TaxID=2859783 RepID=A0A9X1FY80_9RHOB|nr:Rossmann-like fold-containing protein [Roseobacter insulae]MBW4709549.1 DUF2431 domain-containing protein [Roseobacter insulae]